MPEISRFFDIVIRVFYNDHVPPHFHAAYSDHQAIIGMETFAVLEGTLPPRALGLVTEWAAAHQEELLDRWGRSRRLEPLPKIDPLS